jgi:hypothetical protein
VQETPDGQLQLAPEQENPALDGGPMLPPVVPPASPALVPPQAAIDLIASRRRHCLIMLSDLSCVGPGSAIGRLVVPLGIATGPTVRYLSAYEGRHAREDVAKNRLVGGDRASGAAPRDAVAGGRTGLADAGAPAVEDTPRRAAELRRLARGKFDALRGDTVSRQNHHGQRAHRARLNLVPGAKLLIAALATIETLGAAAPRKRQDHERDGHSPSHTLFLVDLTHLSLPERPRLQPPHRRKTSVNPRPRPVKAGLLGCLTARKPAERRARRSGPAEAARS